MRLAAALDVVGHHVTIAFDNPPYDGIVIGRAIEIATANERLVRLNRPSGAA